MKKNGFTVMELLIVISIISLLSSIILASLTEARAKARDANRIQDFNNLSLALALYNSKYQKYPCTAWRNIAEDEFEAGEYYIDDSYFVDPEYEYVLGDEATVFLNGYYSVARPGLCVDGTGIINEGFYSAEAGQGDRSPYPYMYMTPNPERDEYILFTRLESNTSLMKNDGGLCDNYYEKGTGVGKILPFTTTSNEAYSGYATFQAFSPDIYCDPSE